jgi:glutaredoxin
VKKILFLLLISAGLSLSTGAVSAEIYKYVDADGKIHFTDDPPTESGAEKMRLHPTNTIESGAASLLHPAQSSPADIDAPKVELFVTSWCGYCKKAEAYLRKKGVAFTSYDIEKDLQAAKRKDSLTSKRGVPFALIGAQKLTGFSEASYAQALQAAE